MNKSSNMLNKKKHRKDEDDSDAQESLDNSFEKEIKTEKIKKSEKPEKSAKRNLLKEEKENEDMVVGKDEVTLFLTQKKRLNIRKFKGNVLVDIREFWNNDAGDWKPGKKGISLTLDNWNKIKEYMDDIDSAIKNMK